MGRVLLVEDQQLDRDAIARILRAQGHVVQTASTPAEAMEKFVSFNPDFAVIDYRCHNSGPHDEAGVLVATRSDPLIPKIMISGYADRDEIMKAVDTTSEGFAIAIRFLSKDDVRNNSPKFMKAVADAMDIRAKWLRQSRESIGTELRSDHTVARVALVAQVAILLAGTLGFASLGIYLTVVAHATAVQGIVALVTAVLGEWLMWVLIKKSEPVFKIARASHAELFQQAALNHLLDACERIADPRERDAARRRLIESATSDLLVARAGTPKPK